jgi:hypothetical protein
MSLLSKPVGEVKKREKKEERMKTLKRSAEDDEILEAVYKDTTKTHYYEEEFGENPEYISMKSQELVPDGIYGEDDRRVEIDPGDARYGEEGDRYVWSPRDRLVMVLRKDKPPRYVVRKDQKSYTRDELPGVSEVNLLSQKDYERLLSIQNSTPSDWED